MLNPALVDILLISFFIKTIRALIFHAGLWQRKEYRLDRMIEHLSTRQGKRLLWGPMVRVKWVTLLIYPLFAFLPLPSVYFYLVTAVILIEAVRSLENFIRGTLPYFSVGLRTFTVILVAGALIIALIIWSPLFLPFWLIVIDRLTALIIAALFQLSRLPFFGHEQYVIIKARERIQHVKPIVIGITGSYGKTSTKEFLFHILSPRFEVAKTLKSQNSRIGVAEAILSSVNSDTKFFIAEMGAYKAGEIAAICELTRPSMAIITGINEQHLSFFGNLRNTMRAKYELISHLYPGGTAVINGNNHYCQKLAQWAQNDGKRVIIYERLNTVKSKGFFATNVRKQRTNISFDLTLSKEHFRVKIPLLGEHNVENILAACTAAYLLDIDSEEIVKALSTLKAPPKTMRRVKSGSLATWIDDSFNSNPEAVRVALNYMNLFKRKRVLVLQPLIELGHLANDIHYQLGQEAGSICNLVILTNSNYYESFAKGFNLTKSKKAILTVANYSKAKLLLRDAKGKEDVVVFEGKEAGTILKKIKTY